jgi:membrane-associated phospholipid phosphatase
MTIDRQQALRELKTTDLAVYQAIAVNETPTLDGVLRRLSRAADHSVLWSAIGMVLAARPGPGRDAAKLGLASIGVASVAVNIAGKTVFPRARPDRVAAAVPVARHVRMPGTGSFPSGHSASAFAFASAVGSRLPWASLPLHVLAVTVAYSRVHTGVHYPTDTLIGAAVGSASAAVTCRLAGRTARRRAGQ